MLSDILGWGVTSILEIQSLFIIKLDLCHDQTCWEGGRERETDGRTERETGIAYGIKQFKFVVILFLVILHYWDHFAPIAIVIAKLLGALLHWLFKFLAC